MQLDPVAYSKGGSRRSNTLFIVT